MNISAELCMLAGRQRRLPAATQSLQGSPCLLAEAWAGMSTLSCSFRLFSESGDCAKGLVSGWASQAVSGFAAPGNSQSLEAATGQAEAAAEQELHPCNAASPC